MSTPETAISNLVYYRQYRSLAAQPGGTVMYAYLTFNEGIGPDRSHGTVSGHISLKQSGVEPGSPDIGDFIVSGTFALLELNATDTPQPFTVIFFRSEHHLFGQQTLQGHIALDGTGKSGSTTFSYTPKGGHPLFTVANAKVEQILLGS